jgi:glycosyltransferase involved in cell wall biosynthesis
MRGGQWQVLRLLRGLRVCGVESILLSDPDGPLGSRAAQEGFHVHTPLSRLPAADLVHTHDARAHTIAALRSRTPIIVARRVAFPVKTGWTSRWKYRRAERYIAVSRFVADRLATAGVDAARISIVHDGVPLLPQSSRSGGVLHLAKSAADLEEQLLHARAMVYLTDAEGLGSAALLAMSAGVPVIASRIGGLPEVIEDGVNGLLIDTADQAAEALARLESDADFAVQLAANARRTVEERFTVERMVDDTLAVYRRVLKHA